MTTKNKMAIHSGCSKLIRSFLKLTLLPMLVAGIVACGGGSGGDTGGDDSVTVTTEVNNAISDDFTDAAGGDTGGNMAGGTSGVMVVDSQFSCSGSRTWGPFPVSGETLFYISEPAGLDVSRCLAFWEYNPAEGCSLIFSLDQTVDVQVPSNGDAVATDSTDGSMFQLQPADINAVDLAMLPDCTEMVSDDEPVFGGTVPNDTGNNDAVNDAPSSTESPVGNSNGAGFGVDVPPFQDLVLVSRNGLVLGVGGVALLTVRQSAIVRLADGTAIREISNWFNNQNPELGSWNTVSPEEVVFNFGDTEITSNFAPHVASRTLNNLSGCYERIGPLSLSRPLNLDNYCFNSDGTFTTSGGTSVSLMSGNYEIDGNVIRLTLQDGTSEVHLFGAYLSTSGSGEVFAISIGDTVYNLDRG